MRVVRRLRKIVRLRINRQSVAHDASLRQSRPVSLFQVDDGLEMSVTSSIGRWGLGSRSVTRWQAWMGFCTGCSERHILIVFCQFLVFIK
jgi:hypothetical protein